MRSSAILLVALANLSSPVRGIEVGQVTTLGVVISEPSEDVNWNAISFSSADGRLFVSSDDEKIIRVLDMAAETSSQLSGL